MKKLAFFVGDHPFRWNEDSLYQGKVGGTEESVIYVTKRLADKEKFEIFVFNEPPVGKKNFEHDKGVVKYRHFNKFNPKDNWEAVFLLEVRFLRENRINLENVKTKFLWHHTDVDIKDYKDIFDHFLFVSNWQRDLFKYVDDSDIKVVENGVDIDEFNFTEKKQRDPLRCVYTSSPDRGLENILLKIWPRILSEVPEAELHWFYGWESYDWVKGETHWKNYMIDLINRTPNVFSHGKVSQKQIANEYKKASIWLYPTEFGETYCISAVKAQLGGSLPITTNVAALDENVQFGVKLDTDHFYTDPKAQKKVVEKTCHFLKNEEKVKREMSGSKTWVKKNKTWSQVVQRFLNVL